MRRIVVAALVLSALVATALLVWAGGQSGGRVDRQSYAWTEDAVTTQNADWEAIEGLHLRTGCQGNTKSSATVSLELADGSSPVQVRVAVSDPLCVGCEADLLHPAEVSLSSRSGSSTFVGRADGSHGTAFAAQWRLEPTAPPNSSATLESGTLHVLWKKLHGTCQ